MTFPNAGEKAVNAPTTVGGFTYIGTNTPQVPSSDACSTLGVARGYQINFLTGASNFVTFANGGLPPSPVAGLVDVTVDGTDRLVPFCLGCGNPGGTGADSTSSIGGGKPPIPVPPVRKRLYWYLDKHDH
jgi:type IV pilus assembly protein PilY1